MLISLIIPCYNEEAVLPIMYDELCRVSDILKEYEFEYIFIDDGSKDKTLNLLRNFADNDKRVIFLSFARNFGKEAAMYAGFCNAKGDYIAVMDADMQDPPSLLPEMLDIINSGNYDSVATRRETRKGEPKVRSFFAKMFYRLINKMSDAEIVDGARDFRLMKREMVDAIVEMGEYNRFSKGIFGWVGYRTYWLPYENVERVA
ncbi:MAG: glycosyltransferase family 2 protein, partial [Clostridia bacterium]|nr:glycosyltransferase family 2 protein [Clostridia bacterium]